MKKCNKCCLVPELAPKLVQTGWLDPPHAGWRCPVCRAEYHQYVEKKSNLPKAWRVKGKEDGEWIRVF